MHTMHNQYLHKIVIYIELARKILIKLMKWEKKDVKAENRVSWMSYKLCIKKLQARTAIDNF